MKSETLPGRNRTRSTMFLGSEKPTWEQNETRKVFPFSFSTMRLIGEMLVVVCVMTKMAV